MFEISFKLIKFYALSIIMITLYPLLLLLAALAIVSPQDPVIRSSLGAGEILYQNQFLTSQNGAYFFKVQPDGNCVIYMSPHFVKDNAIWSSNSNNIGKPGRKLQMQIDGNLVLRGGNNQMNWVSNTPNKGDGGYYLLLQNDANLVVYDRNNKVIWASNSWRT